MSKILRLSLVALMLFTMSVVASAQSTVDGAISGTVVDPNGAVVPNAAVSVKNEGTNKETTTTTDNEGRFRVQQLSPGSYTVAITATGFGTFSQSNITVEVGRATSLDIPLSVGGAGAAQVDVTAEAPVINTQQQDFSTNVNQTSINELPINGRRWSNFALLTPGAVPDGSFGLISFRGISGLLNNNTIDGGDNNQAFFAEERGRTRISYSVSQAAIREFQVNTSSYSAEYGRSAGGVVNAVTKSGTNEFHGQVFYYQRNNKWGARNPRSFITQNVGGVFTPVGLKPEDVRHQFGGAIGGPIVKDKAFFFFSYDQQKRNFPGVATFSALDFLNRADTCLLTRPVNAPTTVAQCPAFVAGGTRTGALALGGGLTTAQVNTALGFLSSITGEVPRRGDQKLFLPKFDWNINDKNTFTATYNRLRWESPAGIQTQAINNRARDNFGDDFVEIDTLNLRLTSTITPAFLNEFRFQWSTDNEFQFSQPPLPGAPTNSVGGRSPQTFLTNGLSFGIPEFLERVAFPNERRIQFADTMTYSYGNHTFKFGGDLNFVRDEINNLRFSGGEFSYTGGVNAAGFYGSLNDFIIDYTNFLTPLGATAPCYSVHAAVPTRFAGRCYGGNFNQGFGVLGLTMSTTDINLFVQDDWRASQRLTLNFGLRYEVQQNPEPIAVNPLLPQTANKVSDNNNFGPRFGFAYDATGDGKTSVRGGYGIYYGRVINSTVYNTLVNTGVGIAQGQRQVTLTATTGGPSYPNLIAGGALTTPAVQFFSPEFQLPQIHQMDFIVEREIARNTVVSASYLYSYGNSLPNFVDTNLRASTGNLTLTPTGGPFVGQPWTFPIYTGARPNTAFGQITEVRSNVYSKYNALVLQANRRLTNDLQFQVNYTLSRAQDNGQTSATFTLGNVPLDAFNQPGEVALSAFDRRQKFSASAVYNTNFTSLKDNGAANAIINGWTFAPIFNAFSGARYTGNVSGSIGGTAGGVNGSGGATRFGLVPRNFFKQPNIWYLDLRVSRRFPIGEKMKLEVLAESFNLFNRTLVTGVNSTLYTISGSNLVFNGGAAGFGTTTFADSTLFRERQVQLAVRFEF